MHKIFCGKCGVGIFSDAKLKEWTCSPCLQNLSPSSLKCKACNLSNGVLLSTSSEEWIHLFCALLLKPYVKSTAKLKSTKSALNCTVNLDLPEILNSMTCNICKAESQSLLIDCSACKNYVHLSCIVNKNWKMVN